MAQKSNKKIKQSAKVDMKAAAKFIRLGKSAASEKKIINQI